MIVPFVYGAILAAAHFISDTIHTHKRYRIEIRSFAAGISLAYLLTYLLPELYGGIVDYRRMLILFVLLGAVIFHVIEKYLYQHERKNKLIFELRAMHVSFFFLYHFIIGIVIVAINTLNAVAGLLFFVPILFYTAASQVSLSQLHAKVTEKLFIRIVLSLSTLFGVTLATLYHVPPVGFYSLLAFVAGALLYNVMVDVIPKEKDGSLLFFMFGVFAYLVLILSLGGI